MNYEMTEHYNAQLNIWLNKAKEYQMKDEIWEQFDTRLNELCNWVKEEQIKANKVARNSIDRRKKGDRRDQQTTERYHTS